jgi:hypothetical protein
MAIKGIEGLPVIDARKPLQLHITPGDINRADIKEPHNCAVARACKRELHVIEARIHLSRVYLKTNKGSWTRYFTPDALRAEIIAFDRGGSFEPGEFTLKVPIPSKKLGKRRGSMTSTNSQRKRRREYHSTSNVRTGPA